ncbi:Hin recombinase [Streptomyces cacaoi]
MAASDKQRAWNERDRPLSWGGKLTPVQRATIRVRLEGGEKAVDLAAEYGVSPQTIRRCHT